MLTPNGPKERIEYVVKTYRNTKNRRIIPEFVEVSLGLLGFDAAASQFAREYNPLWHYLWSNYPNRLIMQIQAHGHPGTPSEEQVAGYAEALLDEIGPTVRRYTGDSIDVPHPHAFLIPWIGREMGRLNKAVRRSHATERDYEDAVAILKRKAPAIAMWADRESVDITQVSLAEALEAVRDYEPEDDEGTTQGVVVYEYDDGWTIQDLRDPQCLSDEGQVMQHCVGGVGYAEAVRQGRTLIYSLRDPKGEPHATIEIDIPYQSPEWVEAIQLVGGSRQARQLFDDPAALVRSSLTEAMTFEQIRGKQNEMPAVKYRERIQAFIEDCFDSDPTGMLMVAMPGQTISFRNQVLTNVDFTDDFAFGDVPLEQADWSRGRYVGCTWPELFRAKFKEAIVDYCRFSGDLEQCDFDDAVVRESVFASEQVLSTSFREVGFHSVRWDHGTAINGCDFTGALFKSCVVSGAEFQHCDLVDVVISDTVIEGSHFYKTEMDGLTLKGTNTFRQLQFRVVNLANLSPRVVDELLGGAVGMLPDDVQLPDDYEPKKHIRR